MRRLALYPFVYAASLLATAVAHAQNEPLPSIVLTAAADVPVGLLARMRGELTAAGLAVGAELQTGQGGREGIAVVVRQTGSELIAEVNAVDEAGGRRSRVLSVPFVAGDSADEAAAGSELAVRTAEVLRTQLTSRSLNLESTVAAIPPPPQAAVVTARGVRLADRASPPPWLISAGAGVVSGFIAGQSQIISELNVAHVWRSGWFGGLGVMLPFSDAVLTQKQGTVAAQPYLGRLEGGVTRAFAQRWRWSAFASGGFAATYIEGNGIDPLLSNSATSYAFSAAAGGNLGVTVAPNVIVLLQARLMTLQPRPGIRVEAVNTATAAWVLPSATLALGVSW